MDCKKYITDLKSDHGVYMVKYKKKDKVLSKTFDSVEQAVSFIRNNSEKKYEKAEWPYEVEEIVRDRMAIKRDKRFKRQQNEFHEFTRIVYAKLKLMHLYDAAKSILKSNAFGPEWHKYCEAIMFECDDELELLHFEETDITNRKNIEHFKEEKEEQKTSVEYKRGLDIPFEKNLSDGHAGEEERED